MNNIIQNVQIISNSCLGGFIQTGKTNYLLYVDNDLAGDLPENERDFLNLKVLINKIYNENN